MCEASHPEYLRNFPLAAMVEEPTAYVVGYHSSYLLVVQVEQHSCDGKLVDVILMPVMQ